MVINNYKGGQLANRILSFAHLAANSIEHQYALYNPEFDEYCKYFQSSSSNDFLGYPISVKIFKTHMADRLFSRALRLWSDLTSPLFTATGFYKLYRIFKTHDKKFLPYDMNQPQFVKDATTKTVIVEGWGFRDDLHFQKHADLLRQFFSPVALYQEKVAAIMQQARMKADIIVGVHIRRGDYARFHGGKYFFSDDVYAEKMQSLQQSFGAEGKTCLFLLCSNEKLDLGNFPPELTILFEPRHFITDLYCLAAADAIIGPPSTFSSWASFYGKVPLAVIKDKGDQVVLAGFNQVC